MSGTKTNETACVHAAFIRILDQHIDNEDDVYRIKFGDNVRYLTITTDVFDENTMCRPYMLVPKLAELLPEDKWTRAHITSNFRGSPQITTTNDPLPAIQYTWHHQRVDVLSLMQIKRHRSNVHEVLFNGKTAIAKIAAFEWEIPRIENETWAYSVLHQCQRELQGESMVFPRVLGHLTENERVVGLLLEKIDGEFASPENFAGCEQNLRSIHTMGLVHGDINKYNFIVDRVSGQIKLVDFEYAERFEETAARLELGTLLSELSEETGRGGPAVPVKR